MQRPVKDVLASVSCELASLASLTAALQAQLSPLDPSAPDIEALQSLDALTQTLSCLAGFVSTIGPAIPSCCDVVLDTAISEIHLFALAQRLGGGGHQLGNSEETCELF